jgi:transposase
MRKNLTKRFVGLDVHKRQITACFVDGEGRKLETRTFELTRAKLMHFAKHVLRPTDQVALEATTNCWAVARVLQDHVARVVVSNPLVTKAIAQAKIKTDKVDAHVLAQLLRCDFLPEVWHPDTITQQLRELTGRRAALVQQRTALRNRIHSALAMRLIEAPESLFDSAGQDWLTKLLPTLDAQGQLLISSDLRLLSAVQQEIETLGQQLAKQGWQDQRVRLLMTLPGVDLTVAESVLAALGDIERFPTPEQAAAYLGLVPSTRQSADKCYHGPITKRGNNQARWMLIQASQHIGKHPGPLGHFFRRLKQRKNHNVAVVATARKLVMIAWHMLRKNEPYRYAISRTTETKLAKLRVQATGQSRKKCPAKRTKRTVKLPGGSRVIKSLDRVYASEGLPARQPLTAGEERTIAATQSAQFVADLAHDHVVPRKQKTPRVAEPLSTD